MKLRLPEPHWWLPSILGGGFLVAFAINWIVESSQPPRPFRNLEIWHGLDHK